METPLDLRDFLDLLSPQQVLMNLESLLIPECGGHFQMEKISTTRNSGVLHELIGVVEQKI